MGSLGRAYDADPNNHNKLKKQRAHTHHRATTEHQQIGDAPFTVQRHMHGPTDPSGKEQIRHYHRCVGQGIEILAAIDYEDNFGVKQ